MLTRTRTISVLLCFGQILSCPISGAAAAFIARSSIARSSFTRTSAVWSALVKDTSDDAASALQPSALRKVTFRDLNKSQQPQLLCDFLMEIGACSTSITDAHRDTPNEVPIFREFDDEDDDDDDWILRDYNGHRGEDTAAVVCGDAAVGTNVWNTCHVSALFPASTDLTMVANLVESALDIPLLTKQGGGYNVSLVPDMDWVIHVQQSWKPIVVNNIVLKFPWHTQQDVEEATQRQKTGSKTDEDIVQLELQGGIAFGTGEHATTQLCLGWIQRHIDSMERLMDYGCGSGILGMAACKLATAAPNNGKNISKKWLQTVVGVDLDVDAVGIANSNARINQVHMVNYLPPQQAVEGDCESESVLLVKNTQGEQILPSHLNRPIYDALVANILAGPLIKLAPTLAGLLRPASSSQQKGSIIGLSGVLKNQASAVIKAYEPYFDDMSVEEGKGGWVLITGTRNGRHID